MIIKPEIRAAWQHEYGDAAYALDSSFANGAGGVVHRRTARNSAATARCSAAGSPSN